MTVRSRSAALVVAALVLLVAAPAFVFGVHLPRFVTRETPIAGVAAERSRLPVPAPPGRLSVVIVDGLGYDYGRDLEALAWLRADGALRPLRVEYPSYTSPALVALTTGLGPRDSGVRLNATIGGTIALDNLGAVARDAGRPIAFHASGWEPFADLLFAPQSELVPGWIHSSAAPFLHRWGEAPAFGIFYFGWVDAEGHRHGERSHEFRIAADRSARIVLRHAATLDLARDRLLIVADHGHLADGGHGGDEPEVMRAYFALLGAGVRRGVELDERPFADVAATLAVLAGLPTPGSNLGRPMLDLLEQSPDERARALAGPFDQAAGFYCRLLKSPRCQEREALSQRLARGEHAAVAPAERWLEQMRGLREGLLAGGVRRAEERRLGVMLLCGAPFGLLWRRARRISVRPLLAVALCPLLLIGVYALGLYLQGYRLTFSKMAGRELFIPDATVAMLVALVLVVALAWRARVERHAPVALMAGTVLPFLLAATIAGIDPSAVPAPASGLLVILLGPTLLGAAVGALVLLALARLRG